MSGQEWEGTIDGGEVGRLHITSMISPMCFWWTSDNMLVEDWLCIPFSCNWFSMWVMGSNPLECTVA